MIKFEDLVGKEVDFYGVDNNCFKLNNSVFEAIEDKDDGYRSMLNEIKTRRTRIGLIFFKTPIAKVTVTPVDVYDLDGCKLIDSDGHVWLEIGTSREDSYYPWFVFTYHPKEAEPVEETKSKWYVVDAKGQKQSPDMDTPRFAMGAAVMNPFFYDGQVSWNYLESIGCKVIEVKSEEKKDK